MWRKGKQILQISKLSSKYVHDQSETCCGFAANESAITPCLNFTNEKHLRGYKVAEDSTFLIQGGCIVVAVAFPSLL